MITTTFYWKIKTQDLCYRKQMSWRMYVVFTHDPGECQNPHYWGVNSFSGNCLGPSGNKPLPEPILNQGPISRRIFRRDSNSRENFGVLCNAIIGYHIATKFYTCHDSITVVPCAKFHTDHFHKTTTIAEWNFHWTGINMDKLFAIKWTKIYVAIRFHHATVWHGVSVGTVWRHRTRLTLVQLIPCYLSTPIHNLI